MPYANDYTTLLSGSYWGGAEVTDTPVILTYSFLATEPTNDPHMLGATVMNSFAAFTAQQQTLTQQALARWASVSGVVFEQVAPGEGDINFAAYNLTSGLAGEGGEGFFPWGNWNYSTATGSPYTSIHFAADIQANGYGDVLMNTAAEDSSGQFSYETLLHEIGHALGLKHPTEAWTTLVAHNQWDDDVIPYYGNFSIMTPGGIPSTLTDITDDDILAIDSIYGTAAQKGAQFASWSWNASTYTLTGTLNGGGQTVRGTSISNTITGGSGDDTIYAIGQGVNKIFGKAGDDTLIGGSGVNYLDGGAGSDTLNGWFSVNTFASYADAPVGVTVNLLSPYLNTGDAAGDVYVDVHNVLGSNYADNITADSSNDIVYGGAGDDTITGGAGDDRLYGQAGNDTLIAGTGTNYLDGGPGADTLIGYAGAASYASYTDATSGVTVNLLNPAANTGDAAGDAYSYIHDVLGSNYADTIIGDNAGDILYGEGGDDTLEAGGGISFLYGQGGKDTLIAGAGTSYLDGGAGADTLIGAVGHASYAAYSDATAAVTVNLLNPSANTGDAAGDSYTNIHDVVGSRFGDTIIGDNNGDVLNGGGGNDTIIGGSGADILIGGGGNDTLTGGGGANEFRYANPTSGGDTITDFNAAQGDAIWIYHTAFDNLPVGALNPADFADGSANAATGQLIWVSATHKLFWDSDGTGPAAPTLIATLQGVTTLTASNIEVY